MKFFLTAMLLFAVIAFTGCTKDDEAEPSDTQGPIKGLVAEVSADNGTWINLEWEEIELGIGGRYKVYRAVNGGEFTKRGDSDDNTFWDSQTETSTTYSYFVHYKESYSDTIEVTTAHKNQPFVHTTPHIIGEGDDAYIEYVNVNWRVGSHEEISEFEIYRDGELIATEASNVESFRDYSSLQFDQEYAWSVTAKCSNGETYESSPWAVTYDRPEAIDRPAPEILEYISDNETKTVDVVITDVSDKHTDLIHFKGELEGLNYSWDFQHEVNYFGKDDDGNILIGLSTDGADLPTGQTIWLKSQVRIFTQGDWSDWSDSYRFFVF